MFSTTGCPALQRSAHIFSAKPTYVNALRQQPFYSPINILHRMSESLSK